MYQLLIDNIPAGTNASKGINIGNLINLEPADKVMAVSSLDRESTAKYVVFITKKGLIKKTSIEEYKSVKRATGIIAIKINEEIQINRTESLDSELMQLKNERKYLIELIEKGK